MRKISLALALLTGSLVTGCDGGSGSSTVAAPLVADFTLASSQLHVYSAAEQITYNVSASSTGFSDGSGAFNLTGSLIQSIALNSSIVTDPVTGSSITPPLAMTQTLSIVGGGLSISNSLFSQDASGNFFTHSLSGAVVNFPTGSLDIKSPLNIGLFWSESYIVDDAVNNTRDTVVVSCNVTGIEIVQTGLGNFESYKLSCSETSTPIGFLLTNDPSNTSFIAWVFPSLGIIKSEETLIEHTVVGPFVTLSSISVVGTNIGL